MQTDGELQTEDLTLETAEIFQRASPWGQSFPEPSFDGRFEILQQRIVGEKHLKLRIRPAGEESDVLDAICFNVNLQTWPNTACKQAHMVYRLDINEFRNNITLQLLVEQIEPM